MSREHPQVKRLRDPDDLLAHLDAIGASLPYDREVDVAALAAPIEVAGRTCANRFVVLPMEGWDGTDDGRPTDLVRRRWSRFGTSGAGLVWGGEAFAVRADGRANPRQLSMGPTSAGDLAELHALLDPSQVTGLQLTHSGRWSLVPRPARHDPLLDARKAGEPLTPSELDALADDYVAAALLARDAGFDFVDVKACHGYLLHELLSNDGTLEERAALQRTVIERVRAEGIRVGVRLSAFDVAPHRKGDDGIGEPEADDGWGFRLGEAGALLDLLDVDLVCVTGGSPYYCPHAQRPAFFPPSDGYLPPEDPLVGVERLLRAAQSLVVPGRTVVASGLSYLQEHLPNVASGLLREGWCDLVGYGRMVLSYPDLPADVLAGRGLDARRICRTFSDCTTAPRNGMVSGCWPLDAFYKQRDDRAVLAKIKREQRA